MPASDMSTAAEKRVASRSRRRLERYAVALKSHLRDGSVIMPVEVADLSTDGCRVLGEIALEQATEVWLKLPGVVPRAARVAWARRGEAGCEFNEPIDEAVVSAAVQAAGPEVRIVDRRRHPSTKVPGERFVSSSEATSRTG